MLSTIMSLGYLRLALVSIAYTFSVGRTTVAEFPDSDLTWKKTVIVESRETGFSISKTETSWDRTHIRLWMPDDVSEPTLDLVIDD